MKILVKKPIVLDDRVGLSLVGAPFYGDKLPKIKKAISLSGFCAQGTNHVAEYGFHPARGHLIVLSCGCGALAPFTHGSYIQAVFFLDKVEEDDLTGNESFERFARQFFGINPRFLAHLICGNAPDV